VVGDVRDANLTPRQELSNTATQVVNDGRHAARFLLLATLSLGECRRLTSAVATNVCSVRLCV
jgi:hypothetical protein